MASKTVTRSIASTNCEILNATAFDYAGLRPGGGGGGMPYMGYIGTCRCEGYGFQAVYSRIGYINQS